jgi:hypothetical protein
MGNDGEGMKDREIRKKIAELAPFTQLGDFDQAGVLANDNDLICFSDTHNAAHECNPTDYCEMIVWALNRAAKINEKFENKP